MRSCIYTSQISGNRHARSASLRYSNPILSLASKCPIWRDRSEAPFRRPPLKRSIRSPTAKPEPPPSSLRTSRSRPWMNPHVRQCLAYAAAEKRSFFRGAKCPRKPRLPEQPSTVALSALWLPRGAFVCSCHTWPFRRQVSATGPRFLRTRCSSLWRRTGIAGTSLREESARIDSKVCVPCLRDSESNAGGLLVDAPPQKQPQFRFRVVSGPIAVAVSCNRPGRAALIRDISESNRPSRPSFANR